MLWVFKPQRAPDVGEKRGNVCGQVLALLSCAVGIGTSLRVCKLCKAVKKMNVLVKPSPLFFQFT